MKKIQLCVFAVITLFFASIPLKPVEAATTYAVYIAKTDFTYTQYSEQMSYEEAYDIFSALADRDAVIKDSDGKVIAMKEGIAVTQSSGSTMTFTSKYPGSISTYAANGYASFYVSTNKSKVVTLILSGYKGTIGAGSLILIPSAFCHHRNGNSKYCIDYYTKNSSGDLVHYVSRYSGGKTSFVSIIVDKAPSFMKQGTRYYSTDGYTYYSDPINAVNEKSPVGTHLIYYKHLSYRTVTKYTTAELNSYIAYRNSTVQPGTKSKYLNLGSVFIEAQDKYGVNAAMELAFADHESYYGKSAIAQNKNNFFGVNAVDSDSGQASTYNTPRDGILQHAKWYMNRYYLDAYAYIDSAKGTAYYDVPDKDKGYITSYRGDSKYFGPVAGNKLLGINVKYASGPFHGEGVAGRMYSLDSNLGLKDYGRYTIGETTAPAKAYSEPSTSSWVLYKYTSKDPDRPNGKVSNVPLGMNVVIIGDYGDFYKILSDMPVNEDKRACNNWDYNHDTSVAYVLKSQINILFTGTEKLQTPEDEPPEDEPEEPVIPAGELTSSRHTVDSVNGYIRKINSGTSVTDFVNSFSKGSVEVYSGDEKLSSGEIKTGYTVKIYNISGEYLTSYKSIVTGDVNGDGKITITDLVQINNHLLNTSVLKKEKYYAADINGDGKLSITDLVQINNHLLGSKQITPN